MAWSYKQANYYAFRKVNSVFVAFHSTNNVWSCTSTKEIEKTKCTCIEFFKKMKIFRLKSFACEFMLKSIAKSSKLLSYITRKTRWISLNKRQRVHGITTGDKVQTVALLLIRLMILLCEVKRPSKAWRRVATLLYLLKYVDILIPCQSINIYTLPHLENGCNAHWKSHSAAQEETTATGSAADGG